MSAAQPGQKIPFISCGILKKEIMLLAQKNQWPLDFHFLNSSLHMDFGRLSTALNKELEIYGQNEPLVFYGVCHPLMDRMLKPSHAIRTMGQNCVDILLGHEKFEKELRQGAFFLLEDWVLRFREIVLLPMGQDMNAVRAIFHSEQKYFLAITTPASGDFLKEAEAIAAEIDLPLRWFHAGLEHLEETIRETLQRRSAQK